MAGKSVHKFQVKEVVQIGYAVKDIAPVVEKWSSLYGIGPWTYAENSGTDAKGRPWKARMASAYVGPLQIELVQPVEGRIFQSRFLDTWGEGVHHIAFYVDDVDAEAANLVAQGAKLFVQSPGRFAYLDAGGVGGAVFELITRPRESRNR
jgi:catechol 2,3-dioxygenase-like lactoylglutathione lyase family enzyme